MASFPSVPTRVASRLALTLACLPLTGCAQGPSKATFLDRLDTAWSLSGAANWSAAAPAWESITELNPINGEFWRQLARARYGNAEYAKAIGAYKRAMDLGLIEYRSLVPYEIARCYGQLGDTRQAMAWFERSMKLGYRYLDRAAKDPALKPIAETKRFKELTATDDLSKVSRAQGWCYDWRLLSRELVRRRVDPFRHVSKEMFEARVRQVEEQIPKLTDLQMVAECMKLAALLKDGHTCVYTSFTAWPQYAHNLPIYLEYFQEGLFITAADRRFSQLLGAQVLAFDKKSESDVLHALEPLVHQDNSNGRFVVGTLLVRNLPLLASQGIIKDSAKVMLTVKTSSGKNRNVELPGDSDVPTRRLWDGLPPNWLSVAKGAPLYLKNFLQDYWFEFLPKEKAVFLQWSHVRDNPAEPIATFFRRASKFIDEHDVDKLIIDLRWNNGGDTWLVPRALEAIVANAKVNKPGKLFVITSSWRTYSAAQNAASMLERFTHATFVGDGTGSSPNFIGEDTELVLPYSKLVASISDIEWVSSWPLDYRTWIPPTLYVPRRFADHAAGRDACLEEILRQ